MMTPTRITMRSEIFTKSLDELEADLFVTTLFENERPPRGLTGLVDWRMNGFISRKILEGTITGAFGEIVLLPSQGRLPARRVLLVGLGRPEEYVLTKASHIGFRVATLLMQMNVLDAGLALRPAIDERVPGETRRILMDALRVANVPDTLFIHWLEASTEARPEFLASPTITPPPVAEKQL